MSEAVRRKELRREYKQAHRDMGVVGLRNLNDNSVVLLPSADVQGTINKYDFAKKTNSALALPSAVRAHVEQSGFDNFVIEVIQLIDPKPEATTKERLDELEVLYEVLKADTE